jgi:Protein of unknown function DUF262
MQVVESRFTIADYCAAWDRKEIIVNASYQRSSLVWPPAARSFLIETIIMGYPLPKFFLHQKIDVISRKSYKEVVDGQQRSKAIKDFFDNKLRLSRVTEVSELAGKTYSTLTDEQKGKFLNYSLSTDLFIAASSDEIREVFRRLNSYNVPLNPEEQRTASFQGEFKWFIYNLSKVLDTPLLKIGVLKEPNIIRMTDTKLFTEIAHALINGIETTNAKKLDAIYKRFDALFENREIISEKIIAAFDKIFALEEIHNGVLMKPYLTYSLVLAFIHVSNPIETLNSLYPLNSGTIINNASVYNLQQIANAIENPEQASEELRPFLNASTTKTNVANERSIRFQWFCKALLEDKLI